MNGRHPGSYDPMWYDSRGVRTHMSVAYLVQNLGFDMPMRSAQRIMQKAKTRRGMNCKHVKRYRLQERDVFALYCVRELDCLGNKRGRQSAVSDLIFDMAADCWSESGSHLLASGYYEFELSPNVTLGFELEILETVTDMFYRQIKTGSQSH